MNDAETRAMISQFTTHAKLKKSLLHQAFSGQL